MTAKQEESENRIESFSDVDVVEEKPLLVEHSTEEVVYVCDKSTTRDGSNDYKLTLLNELFADGNSPLNEGRSDDKDVNDVVVFEVKSEVTSEVKSEVKSEVNSEVKSEVTPAGIDEYAAL